MPWPDNGSVLSKESIDELHYPYFVRVRKSSPPPRVVGLAMFKNPENPAAISDADELIVFSLRQ
jgi:hypothetical protein